MRGNLPVFKKRGYPDSAITTGKHRAQEMDRETALQTLKNEETDRIPFALTYHPQYLAIKNVIFKNFKILLLLGRAKARNVSFLNLSRWHFNLYQLVLIKPNFCFHLSHRRITTVCLETRNLYVTYYFYTLYCIFSTRAE